MAVGAGHLSFHYVDHAISCAHRDADHGRGRASTGTLSCPLPNGHSPPSESLADASCETSTCFCATCAHERPSRPGAHTKNQEKPALPLARLAVLLRPKSGRVGGWGAGPTAPTEGEADGSCFCEGPVQLGAWTACDGTFSFCPSQS